MSDPKVYDLIEKWAEEEGPLVAPAELESDQVRIEKIKAGGRLAVAFVLGVVIVILALTNNLPW